MPVELVNLTPHAVHLLRGDHMITIEPSGTVARAVFDERPMGYFKKDGRDVPVSRLIVERVDDLPDPRDRTYFIVSSIVQQAVDGRDDLLTPFKTKWRKGKVIGCKHLIQL